MPATCWPTQVLVAPAHVRYACAYDELNAPLASSPHDGQASRRKIMRRQQSRQLRGIMRERRHDAAQPRVAKWPPCSARRISPISLAAGLRRASFLDVRRLSWPHGIITVPLLSPDFGDKHAFDKPLQPLFDISFCVAIRWLLARVIVERRAGAVTSSPR